MAQSWWTALATTVLSGLPMIAALLALAAWTLAGTPPLLVLLIGIADLVFARRLRREPELRRAVDSWLVAADDTGSWVEWEQRKHERLLAA